MAPKSKREDDDPDWVSRTPDIQARKTASYRSRATPARKKSTNNGNERVRMNTKTHELKTVQQPPSKKKRGMRVRMPLNMLVELAGRMADDMRKIDCTTSTTSTTLNLSWMNVRRGRSNTTTPRLDYSPPFAAHIVGQVRVEITSRFKPGKKIVFYVRKGKRVNTNSAVDSAAAAASSSFVAPDQTGCSVVETEQVMEEAEPVANPSNRVQDSGSKANALPEIFKEHIACGKSQSLIDTLMAKKPTPKSERPTPKKHRPKVVDDQMSSTSTPNPPTPKPTINVEMPKPAREVKAKRKLDFGNECSTMKPQDSSSERTSIDEASIVPASIQQEDPSSEINTENVLLNLGDESLKRALIDYASRKMASLCIADRTITDLVASKFDPCKTDTIVIDFDPETLRSWDLLMGHNWSESAEAEGSSDNGEYMKKQRKLFRERVDLFLARMRLYQGDKQFSLWKGSVVDSVIGVYLTQNVSDHLSSNAYMSLASAYPPLSVSEQNSKLARENRQFLLRLENGDGPSSQTEIEGARVTRKGKGKRKQEIPINWDEGKRKQEIPINWDELRIQYSQGIPIKRDDQNADSVNWEAVRQSSAKDLAKVYAYRGMSNQLAGRIQGFLNRLVQDHGSIDLEWLRNVPPPKAKDYLLSFNGLGLKSTECVRLLALHFPSFPVDTNAGRFFVRVGWAPLKPLPESLRMHLLNSYPTLNTVQKYIWPRICDRDIHTLYELHCHSVTIAKSFCTKVRPNCNHCPMRGECKHYASAVASSRLHLEGSQAKSSSDSCSPTSSHKAPMITNFFDGDQSEEHYHSCNFEPIIEFPASPEPTTDSEMDMMDDLDSTSEPITKFEMDMEDFGCEISAIKLNGMDFSENIQNYIGDDYGEIFKFLAAISPSVGSIPMPKQKESNRLRTVHIVYELPDLHPLLAEFEKREPNDYCPYLLAIWPTGTIQDENINFGGSRESREVVLFKKHDRIQGTILIPCRTANRGRFPLNGTYFQRNEVFADYASSQQPIDVPREFIMNLGIRYLFCGTSITSICKGMSGVQVAFCFQKGFICVRAFNRKTRTTRFIKERFHKCKSRKMETDD